MIKAFLVGVKDGQEIGRHGELSSGLTWEAGWFWRQKNCLYDMGVNFGQLF